MEICEQEFKKLVELVVGLISTLEASTKKINQYSAKIEEFAALSAKVEKLLKARAASGN